MCQWNTGSHEIHVCLYFLDLFRKFTNTDDINASFTAGPALSPSTFYISQNPWSPVQVEGTEAEALLAWWQTTYCTVKLQAQEPDGEITLADKSPSHFLQVHQVEFPEL